MGKHDKTEHCGAKHGRGAFWGPKRVAKRSSTARRRAEDRRVSRMAQRDEPR